MKGNKFIRLWVHRGSGGIDDASPPEKRTGVINAAATTIVSILLPFIMPPLPCLSRLICAKKEPHP